MRMELELGKWLLDVAKYMLTALMFANVFGDLSSPWLMVLVIIIMFVFLLVGLELIKRNTTDKNIKKKGK